MKRSIDKLMIGFVMILAACLYAPTILDCNSNIGTEEKVTETLAEAPAPEKTTETVAQAETMVTPKYQAKLAFEESANNADLADGLVKPMVESVSQSDGSALMTYVNTLPARKEIKPSLMANDEMEKAKAIQDNYDDFLKFVETFYAQKAANQAVSTATVYETTYTEPAGDGKLTASKGVNYGPSGKETYYNLNMNGVVSTMQSLGYNEQYWVREDGVKMYGNYVMVAADLNTHPRGSLVESSLGTAIVVDTGGFAASNPNQLDIATAW